MRSVSIDVDTVVLYYVLEVWIEVWSWSWTWSALEAELAGGGASRGHAVLRYYAHCWRCLVSNVKGASVYSVSVVTRGKSTQRNTEYRVENTPFITPPTHVDAPPRRAWE